MRFLFVPLCLLCVSLLANAVPAPAEKKAPAKNLDGTWLCTALDKGNNVVEELVGKLKLTIAGDKITMEGDGEGKKRSKFAFDLTKKPAHIDMMPNYDPVKGVLIPAIFQRDGNTLKLCVRNAKGPRPTEFKSSDGVIVLTFELQK